MRRYNPSLRTSSTGAEGGMELNGITIPRLKNKMGTKSLPTAELEVRGARGWLIGEEGRGIQQISTILSITRLRTATGALGDLGRGLAIARAFTRVREVGGGRGTRVRLIDTPLHMRTLSDMVVEYHGLMLLNFYGAYVMGLEEHQESPMRPPSEWIKKITPARQHVTPLLRILLSLVKAYCSKQAIPLVYACMESMGGVGYLENSETEHVNVARIFRDACVSSIWEGTTDVLGTDFIRALKHPRDGAESIRSLDLLITRVANEDNTSVYNQWATAKEKIEKQSQVELMPQARSIVWKVAEILIATLYSIDVRNDPNPQIEEMYRRFLTKSGLLVATLGPESVDVKQDLRMNQDIVLGDVNEALRKPETKL